MRTAGHLVLLQMARFELQKFCLGEYFLTFRPSLSAWQLKISASLLDFLEALWETKAEKPRASCQLPSESAALQWIETKTTCSLRFAMQNLFTLSIRSFRGTSFSSFTRRVASMDSFVSWETTILAISLV